MATHLIQLAPSPNNVKVRVALGFKNIPYEHTDISPSDRSLPLEISGQPLTPVLQNDGHVIFDSSAILRYLDANFLDTPALYSADYEEMKEIEKWETRARTEWALWTGTVFRQAFVPAPDLELCTNQRKLAAEGSREIEKHLEDNDWLVGNRMTAADIVGACSLMYFDPPDAWKQWGPISEFLTTNLFFEEPRPAIGAWIRRVLAYVPPGS